MATFLFTNTSGLATNLVTFKSIPYDPVKDFTPVAMVVDFGPQMLSVNVDVPVTTVAGLIDHAKANPGKLSYAVDVARARRHSRRVSSTSAPISAWSRSRTARPRRWRTTSPAAPSRC
jgi:tripartite-type tricarboxylate transporter receptor subunit TctC